MGGNNTANGFAALYANTIGADNTANGYQALIANTTGYYNTASGYGALFANTTGANTTGIDNTASGSGTLFANTTGSNNTGNGFEALYYTTTGYYNTANGFGALYNNTTGGNNTADGLQSLFSNITGTYNTAHGIYALFANTTGSNNIALGAGAGQNLTTGSNNVAIGNPGLAGESGAIRIGTAGTHTSTYIAGVNGVTASSGVAVYINANGQLGTLTSSRRFKNAIKDMGSVSSRLMQLRPVTFRYNEAAEKGAHPLQYGLIAEEVAKIYPNLVQYDKAGKPFTIYYHLLTPMLLNELQKAHRGYEAQKAEITTLKVALQKQSAELALMKQSQQQQLSALAKLTALVETSQAKALHDVVYTKH